VTQRAAGSPYAALAHTWRGTDEPALHRPGAAILNLPIDEQGALMTRLIARAGISAISALVLVLAAAPMVAASTPRHTSFRAKDGNYKGTLSVGIKKVVYFTVSQHGTKGVARLVCDGQPYGRVSMPITGRTFSGKYQRSPGVGVWTLSGRFSSKTTATAHLGSSHVCDGKSGNVNLALF
jgi:hypothetical protein